MKEQLKNEILAARKAKFNLNTISTIEVFNKVINAYKKLLLEAERDLHEYTIDIILCDLSGFNRLGGIEELYKKWGDIFFVDLNNSAFVPDFVNEEGDIESYIFYYRDDDDWNLRIVKASEVKVKYLQNDDTYIVENKINRVYENPEKKKESNWTKITYMYEIYINSKDAVEVKIN